MTQQDLLSTVSDRIANHPHIAAELKREILAGLRAFDEAKLKELLSLIEEFDTQFIKVYDQAIVRLQDPSTINYQP